jgi:hypothetical protein
LNAKRIKLTQGMLNQWTTFGAAKIGEMMSSDAAREVRIPVWQFEFLSTLIHFRVSRDPARLVNRVVK